MSALPRTEDLSGQALLDQARYRRIEAAARRACEHIDTGCRTDELRALREIQATVHELTGWSS